MTRGIVAVTHLTDIIQVSLFFTLIGMMNEHCNTVASGDVTLHIWSRLVTSYTIHGFDKFTSIPETFEMTNLPWLQLFGSAILSLG